ncbi:MAG: hypothetical protein H0Z38_06755 [Firmicutes bacterium]|nr:hypothetical protein [Bacillota bacterium]
MNLANCARCGKVFMKVRSPICPDCQREEEELAQKVIEYIKENPEASVAEVATKLEVDVEFIQELIREGRLIKVKPAWKAHCRQCGAPISSGDLCSECRSKLAAELSKAKSPKTQEKSENDSGKTSMKIYLYDRVKRND